MKTQTKNSLMLMLCAFIWATNAVPQMKAQSIRMSEILVGVFRPRCPPP